MTCTATTMIHCINKQLLLHQTHVVLARKDPRVEMSLIGIGPVMFGGTAGIITYLQSKHVLASTKQCPCGTAMILQTRRDISDGCRWRCPSCRKSISIREGSFFDKSRLPLQKWLILIYWWAKQYPVSDAEEEAQVTNTTAIQVRK